MVTSKLRLTTDALVIKEMNVGEQDKLLTLLSREYGVIKAFASGAKNLKSKKFSACSLLSYTDFVLIKSGQTYKVREAACRAQFFDAARDVTLFALSQYFCELAATLLPAEQPAEEAMRLLLNSLHQLVYQHKDPVLLKAVTELRLVGLCGYQPDLIACHGCAVYEADPMYFNTRSGQLFCADCRENVPFECPVSATVLTALRHIVFVPFEKLYAFSIPAQAALQLAAVTEEYVLQHSEHQYLTLDFFHQVT